METQPTEKRPNRPITWKELDFREQMVYIRQAEFLQEKGHFPGVDSFVVAEMLYRKRNK